jgi:ATP-dependent helicase/DNAse subunit B
MIPIIEDIINRSASESLLVVTNNDLKTMILKEMNHKKLTDISFITLPEFIDRLTFSFSPEAVYEVMKNFSIKYDVAKTYLENMRMVQLIDRKAVLDYEMQSLETIEKVYVFLNTKKMIIRDDLFIKYCQRKKILILGYDFIKKEDLEILEKITYEHIRTDLEANDLSHLSVVRCKDLEQELFVALEKISGLIQSGVSLNDIRLIGIREADHEVTRRMFDLYRIPLNQHLPKRLYDMEITKTIVEAFFQNKLDGEFPSKLRPEQSDIYLKTINVLNRYIDYLGSPDETLHEIITSDLKNTYLTEEACPDAVEVCDVATATFLPDKYLFVIGLNQGNVPATHRDEDYFKDSLKQRNGLSTSSECNQASKEELSRLLYGAKHLHLSYRTTSSEPVLPSSIIAELKLKVVDPDAAYSQYADAYNRFLLMRGLDAFCKYGIKDEALNDLYQSYSIPYQEYDNRFKGIGHEMLLDKLNNSLSLSYSSMDSYYKCRFSYYLKYVLKIDENKTTFPIFIGQLFHYVLSKAFDAGFAFDTVFDDYLHQSEYAMTPKEAFLLIKLRKELQEIINTLYEQHHLVYYKDALFEEKVEINSARKFGDRNINLRFSGVIDKILYKVVKDEATGNDVTYVSIVDYKTGLLDIKVDLIEYGLSLQLPVYLYLADNCKKLSNVKVYGFFLQNILHNEIRAEDEADYQKQKTDALKLSGYIVEDIGNIGEFDSTKANSSVIKGLKIKNDGSYYPYSKVMKNDEMESLKNIVCEKIDEATTDILNGEYSINPKLYLENAKREDLSCRFCQFSDICYKTYKNYQLIKSAAGGDKDDEMD